MTTKYTKRQMMDDIAAAQKQLEIAIAERTAIEVADEAGEQVDGDRWNALHDLIDHSLPGAMEEAKMKYLRRNWTAAEWNLNELVAENRD